MNKPVKISVRQADVTEVDADLLLLKFARSFHGADETVAVRLVRRGICNDEDISPADGDITLIDSGGAIAAERVMFLGTPRLGRFRYKEMRSFARRAIEEIGRRGLPIKRLLTTVHGAGYGLDIEEAMQAMMFGFQQGIASGVAETLEEIVFVERKPQRFEVLRNAVDELELVGPAPAARAKPESASASETTDSPERSGVLRSEAPVVVDEPTRKKCVFVAMPFLEEFEDVYQFGIYAAVRKCGYVCEKVDESVFAGSIVERITEGIRNSEFVVADLTQEKPNVYLEVGYAWGLERPVIMVAREGHRLHFDLAHHKCIFYRTIGQLADQLERTILDMFGPESERP